MPTFKTLVRSFQDVLQGRSRKRKEDMIRQEVEADAISPQNHTLTANDNLQHRTARPLVYQPLDPVEMQFRLLTLRRPLRSRSHWTFTNTLMAGNLSTYSMYDCPPYIALSYEWGEESEEVYEVAFATGSIRIRKNLWLLLEILSQTCFRTGSGEAAPRHVWVDQICINQCDDRERSNQVQLMGLIYRHAGSVVAWPGYILEYHRPSYSGEPFLADVLKFLQSRYWGRLWIIQELILPNKVQFLYGVVNQNRFGEIDLCESAEFKLWEDLIAEVSRNGAMLAQADRHFKGLVTHRGQGSRDRPLTLSAAISQYSDSDCLDPRDKVFGLLGIVQQEQRVEVDYKLTTKEVFDITITAVLTSEYNATNRPDHEYEIIFLLLARDMGLEQFGEENISALLYKYRQSQKTTQSLDSGQAISAQRRRNSYG